MIVESSRYYVFVKLNYLNLKLRKMFLLQYSLDIKIEERRSLEITVKVAFVKECILYSAQATLGGGREGRERGGGIETCCGSLRHFLTRKG